MSYLVEKVIGVWIGPNGESFEITYDGADCDWLAMSQIMHMTVPEPRRLEFILQMRDGKRVKLPFDQMAYIIPDHTGVVAIFSAGQYLMAGGNDCFAAPDNAAVFNADGTLRFQIKNPYGKGTSFWDFSGNTFDARKGTGEFRISVRDDHPQADFVHSFLFDGSSSEVNDASPLNIRL